MSYFLGSISRYPLVVLAPTVSVGAVGYRFYRGCGASVISLVLRTAMKEKSHQKQEIHNTKFAKETKKFTTETDVAVRFGLKRMALRK
jgi:hypothetical protein